MASLKAINITSSSITVQLQGLDESYPKDDRKITYRLGNKTLSTTVAAGASNATAKTFTGLEPRTSYTIYASAKGGDWEYVDQWSTTVTTLKKTVLQWSWSSSTARKKAETALNNNGKTTDFSYTVWNELIDKVDEILEATQGKWRDESRVEIAGAPSNIKISASGDKTLYSASYLTLAWQIYRLAIQFELSTQTKWNNLKNISGQGDSIIGKTHFLDLTSLLNNVINYYNNN